MCGIIGGIGKYNQAIEFVEHNLDVLQHRGPDVGSTFFDSNEGVGLGHRRLSILDLSEAANQPFYSHCKRYVMVYNGEIYNYKEIAEKYSIPTKTNSDTEVIIESFALNGPNCVSDFNGMFSIAIWDKLEKSLFLSRDRLGIKPLYIFQSPELFAFASELKVFSNSKIKTTLNHSAIPMFLHLGYLPEPMTFFKEFSKFPSGSYGIFKNGNFDIKPYWKPDHQIQADVLKNETMALSQLESLITSSVKCRMISDVPLGTFLSGGIDSSLVTAIAQKLSDKPIKTFSIGFKDSKFNEAAYARKVSTHLNTDHHEFMLSEKDAIEKVYQLLDIYDEPFADSSAISTLLVSEMARKKVTVCLSGDGGDELFLGYGMYNWAKRLSNPILASVRKPLSKLLSTFGNQRIQRGAKVLNYPTKKGLKSHLFSQEQYFFSERELQDLLIEPSAIDFIDNTFVKRKLSAVEEQSLFDINYYLKDDLLMKVDRASMNHSLEVRVPLLDHRIVEFGLNLDESLREHKGIKKYLLKKILHQYVPKEYFDRPKWGFGVPIQNWLLTDLKPLVDQYLSKQVVESLNIVHYWKVQKLISDFSNGKSFLYNRIWTLLLLHKFLLKHAHVN